MVEIVDFNTRENIDDSKKRVVILLKEVLDQAERGEIADIAIAAIRPNRYGYTRYSFFEHGLAILGCIDILKFDISKEISQEDAGTAG